MLRLVLDTNVVLDLFHWGNVDAVPIMAALEAGEIECLVDARTLDELRRVLTYPQLKLTAEMIRERYARYHGLVTEISAGESPPQVPPSISLRVQAPPQYSMSLAFLSNRLRISRLTCSVGLIR